MATPTPARRPVGATWLTLEAVYIATITAIAIFAMSATAHRPFILVAGLLALPCGIAAVIGLYVLTGLFNWIAAGFSSYSVTHSTGGCSPNGHCWSHTWGTPVGARGFLFSACVVALFTAAAFVNVLILRRVIRNRATERKEPPLQAASGS
jgi:hypothetical protein